MDAGTLGRARGTIPARHFDGVLTVVLNCSHIRPTSPSLSKTRSNSPHHRMFTDLNIATEIVERTIVRELTAGLSSRNVFLTARARCSTNLSAALEKAATQSSVPSARAAAYES